MKKTFVLGIPKNHLEDIQSREMLLRVYKPIISGFTALCALEFFVVERLHAYKGMSTSFHHTYAMVIFVYDNVSVIYRFIGLCYHYTGKLCSEADTDANRDEYYIQGEGIFQDLVREAGDPPNFQTLSKTYK